MNSPFNDSPELTAYALGELSGAQAREVHDLLAATPAATSELEQIEAVTEALRQGAPIPQQRLTPDQRHALLYPAPMPRRISPMMPRPMRSPRPSVLRPAFQVLAKAAALFALACTAFALGRRVPVEDLKSTTPASLAAGSTQAATLSRSVATPAAAVPAGAANAAALTVASSPPVRETAPQPAPVSPASSTPQIAAVAPAASPEAAPAAKSPLIVIPAAPVAATTTTTAKLPSASPPAETVRTGVQPLAKVTASTGKPVSSPTAPGVASLGFTTPPRSDAFVNASRKPSDQCELRPAKIRPLPTKPAGKGEVFASPMPAKTALEAKEAASKSGRPAELFIHSWKSDVITCPWNEANRLLRVVIQLPADQPAVIGSESAYPLQITFDPNHVREYRMLCERHHLAPELRSAGTHIIWYEFQPNGTAEPAREAGKLIATVTLPAARFTTQTVEPFDGTKLRILDRNQSWQSAREDILFESSIIGFGMLLRGIPDTSKLNHQLVLDLATKSKGADPTGDRARFIHLVQDAKLAAGL